MIKISNGCLEMKGSKTDLDFEITLLLNHYRDSLAKKIGVENANNEIMEIAKTATLTDKEIKAETKRVLEELIKELFGE